MFSLVGAILAIGLLIVVHEAGHYFVARWCKMRVDRFSIGFGPALFKWRRGETDFTLGPIPFGGFVQIRGMTLADDVAADDDRAYPNRPAWQRFLTIFAGPATNYLFAIVLGIAVFASIGVPPQDPTSRWTVAQIKEGSDAEGKLLPGDRIVGVQGQPIYAHYKGQTGKSMTEVVDASKGAPLQVTVVRDGHEMNVVVKAHYDKGERGYRLGILLGQYIENVDHGVFPAIKAALYYPVEQTVLITGGLIEIATGKQQAEFKSVVGITDMIKKRIDVGMLDFLQILMSLNVYLGLFNLLPLPALDGGRLVFLGYEMATRRRPNPRIEATVHMVGMMCLLLLLVLVTYKDITKLF
jgi:regulator of sigma E protease